jgi:predicted RNA-binding protein YlqC (UPF0109 family)
MTNETEEVRELVYAMVRALVDSPWKVQVVAVTGGEREVKLSVSVASGDAGKVIGRAGRTARAIRTVLYSASRKLRIVSSLDIDGYVDREGSVE